MGNDHPRGALNTASLNGAKYINVRVGNQIYGIDQYESIYHRPDIVKLAIKLGDTQQAIAQLTLPKFKRKIWFVNPQQGYKTERSRIQVKVETQVIADSAESLTFKVNGRTVGTEKSGKRSRAKIGSVQTYSRQIPLEIGENMLEVEIRGKAGAVQQRSSIIVIREKGTIVEKPDLYYLGIGVAEHPQVPLRYPAKDVTGLEKVLKQQQGKVYRQVVTKTLTDKQATRTNIMKAITTFFEPTKPMDIAILFISGHGMNTNLGYHFVTYDANIEELTVNGVSWHTFNIINNIPAHVVLLVDTCHAGNITDNSKWQTQAQADPEQFMREANLHNVIVLASSSGEDYSIENEEWGHGAFTKALIDGLNGKAVGYKKGVVKLSYLQDYVRERVRELTENAQTPTIPKLSGDGYFWDLVLARH